MKDEGKEIMISSLNIISLLKSTKLRQFIHLIGVGKQGILKEF